MHRDDNKFLSDEQRATLDQIIAIQKERNERYNVHLLDKWFGLSRLHHPAFVGSFAITSPSIGQKWILKHYARDVGGGWATPSDLARDYIKVKYPDRRKRMTTAQYKDQFHNRRNAPFFANPVEYDDGYYIDLKSAYWSIILSVGWDVDYHAGRWLEVKSDNFDFPFPDDKLARNCLVSIGLNGKLQMWDGDKMNIQSKPNAYINMNLWTLVQDVLNGVAYDVVLAGADYVYTDGYICKAENLYSVTSAISRWGLHWGIKHQGEVTINSPACYRVGAYESKPFSKSRPRYVWNVDLVNSAWLRPRFMWWAVRRGIIDYIT